MFKKCEQNGLQNEVVGAILYIVVLYPCLGRESLGGKL